MRRWLAALRGAARERGGRPAAPAERGAVGGRGARRPQAVVWPKLGEEPLERGSRQNYFDSIHHSAAVVGINTSAQIESAGRRPAGAHGARRRVPGDPAGDAALPLPEGRASLGRADARGAPRPARGVASRPRGRRAERALPARVRPAARARRRGNTALRRDARRARLGPRPAPGAARRRCSAGALAVAARRASAPPREEARADAFDELRSVLRKVKRGEGEVVAGPWLGSEVEELLYWIPFLRWAQTATFGLRDRLTVVARAPRPRGTTGSARSTRTPRMRGRVDDPEADRGAARRARRRRPEGPVLASPARVSGGAAGRRGFVGPWGVEAVLAVLEGRRVVVDTPPPRPRARGWSTRSCRALFPELAQSDGSRDPLWERLDEREEYGALVRQRLAHLVPVHRAARARLADPALRRHAAQPALRRPPGVPRASARAEDRLSAEANWPPLDLADPADWFERLFEKQALTTSSRATTSPGRSEGKSTVVRRLPVRLPAAPAEGDLRRAGRRRERRSATCSTPTSPRTSTPGSTTRTSIRGRRRSVTGFTPRLAMDRGEPRALLRRLPRREAGHDRPRPAVVVGVGVEVQPAALSDVEAALPTLARVDGGRARRARGRWSRTSGWSRDGGGDGAARRADGDRVSSGAASADVQRAADQGELRRAGRELRDPRRRASGRSPTPRSPNWRVTCTSGP